MEILITIIIVIIYWVYSFVICNLMDRYIFKNEPKASVNAIIATLSLITMGILFFLV